MLGQYLPTLRPAPVIALTATATPLVQDDIAPNWGWSRPTHSSRVSAATIWRWRWLKCRRRARNALTLELLLDQARRPAIVYAPTRAKATALAAELGYHFPCGAYHAGLDAEDRQHVQQEFSNT